ncbi:MAG TPA: hypothetical protein VLM11_21265 [Streptosporangiaceae bacterium]|nr:hypothetical protein [Streptosporangiaceae bacterium]
MPTTSIQARLRTALSQALSSRDSAAASAVRSALSAIANAEAIAPLETGSKRPSSEHVAGAVAGLGAAEAPRRELTEADIAAMVAAEISDRRSAADDYERMGRADQAERLRREADVLADLLAVRE